MLFLNNYSIFVITKIRFMYKKNNWVEIFDLYFGKKSNQFNEDNNIPDDIKDVINKFNELLANEMQSTENVDNILEEEFGQPNEIIEYTEGNIQYTKKIWNHEKGKIVKIMAKVANGINYDDLSLEEKLKIAIQNEDYEKAVLLRDEIEKRNYNITNELLTEKKIDVKNTENEKVKRKRRKKE